MNIQFAVRKTPVLVLQDRTAVLENLSGLRKEWEAVAEGDSLIDLSVSVGLLLFDVTAKLGLTEDEQTLVLGGRLFKEALNKSQL
ncbi:MAG: hypothetical protein ABI904_17275 [Chloroflexota bacterium]